MRDFKLITPDTDEKEWCLDFDFINGCPALVPEDRNTQDQRAAVSAYMIKGTVPGKPNLGIDWSGLYEQEATMIEIDNSIKQDIQKNAAIPGTSTSGYIPLYASDEKGIHVAVFQAN